MPITSTIQLMLSASPNDFGGGHAQPRPWRSHGGYMSTTELVCGPNQLFDLRREVHAGFGGDWSFTDYRSIFLYNNNLLPDAVTVSVSIWLTDTLDPPAGTLAMGFDPYLTRIYYERAADSGFVVINQYIAPPGVVFSTPTDQATALVVPVLYPGYIQGVWLRRTVPNDESPVALDGASIAVVTSPVE